MKLSGGYGAEAQVGAQPLSTVARTRRSGSIHKTRRRTIGRRQDEEMRAVGRGGVDRGGASAS